MNEQELRKLLQKESCPDDMKKRVKKKVMDQIMSDTKKSTIKVTNIEYRKSVQLARRHRMIKVAVEAACVCFAIGVGSLLLFQDHPSIQPTLESVSITPIVTNSTEEEEVSFMYDILDGATASITRIDPNAVIIFYDEYQFMLPMADSSGYQVGDSFEIIQGATLSEEDKKRDDIINARLDQVRKRFLKDGFAVPMTQSNPSVGYLRTELMIRLGDQMQTFKLGVFDADAATKSYQFAPNENYTYDNTFLLDISANLPDENGIIESKYIPDVMQPGSIIRFVDDTHYTFISGGPYDYTPETLFAEYQAEELGEKICELNQITIVEESIAYPRMLVTYAQDGAIAHCYDFNRFITLQNGWIDNNISTYSLPYVETVLDNKGIKKAVFNIEALVVTGQSQFEKINKTIQEFVTETMIRGKLCLQDHDTDDFTIGVDCAPFEFSCEYDISYNYNGLLQVQFSGYEYTGGIHPTTWLKCFLFDLATGDQVDLAKLVTVDEKTFSNHIYSLLEQEKIKAEEGKEEVPYNGMDLEVAKKLINFDMKYYLTKDGITFYFEPYEVNSYADGSVKLQVDYQDMIFQ